MQTVLGIALTCIGQLALVEGEAQDVSQSFQFSEGPLWLSEGIWVVSDPARGGIYRLDGSLYRFEGRFINGLTTDNKGRLVACEPGAKRLIRVEADGSETILMDSFEGRQLNAPNDVVVSKTGTIYFTDPLPLRKDTKTELDFSGVYSVNADGQVQLISTALKYPNGVALSPDEKFLYVADTSSGNVRIFNLTGDTFPTDGQEFCQVRIPDGMAMDSAGRLWIAASGGVSVFGEDGALLEKIPVRPMPTNCAFGGAEGNTLLVTARKAVAAFQIANADASR